MSKVTVPHPTAVPFLAVLAWGLVLLLPSQGAAQAGSANLEGLRLHYAQSLHEWEQADPNLEDELFRRPAPEMQARIEAAAGRRAAVGAAKWAYLQALAVQYRAAAAELRNPPPPKPELPDFDRQMLSEAATMVGEINADIKAAPAGERARLAALQRQKSEMLELQLSLAGRQRRLESLPSVEAMPRDVDAEAQHLLALASSLESQKDVIANESKAWASLYEAMREEVKRLSVGSSRRPVSGLQASPVRAPVVTMTPGLVLPVIGGHWTIQGPAGPASGLPLHVDVRISQADARVDGTYDAEYAPRGDKDTSTHVSFSFSGTIASEIMRFPLKAPHRGWILIQRAGSARLRVSYEIENVKAMISPVGSIPEERAIELLKQVD